MSGGCIDGGLGMDGLMVGCLIKRWQVVSGGIRGS